jgi:hypothetical protein
MTAAHDLLILLVAPGNGSRLTAIDDTRRFPWARCASTEAIVDMPAPANLSAVFDCFVYDTSLADDSGMMETAAAQCLLLAGFFEDQMRRRHNIRWYAELGAAFFSRAAAREASPQRARLFETMARRFEPWRQRHAKLSRELRDQPFLLARRDPSAPEGLA